MLSKVMLVGVRARLPARLPFMKISEFFRSSRSYLVNLAVRVGREQVGPRIQLGATLALVFLSFVTTRWVVVANNLRNDKNKLGRRTLRPSAHRTSVQLAGGDGPRTLLSVLAAAHSQGLGLLSFFDTREARQLRLVCEKLKEAVSTYAWCDSETNISGCLKSWRLSFPMARAANVSGRKDIVDSDFANNLEGLHVLDMSGCDQAGITDQAFTYLAGIRYLTITWLASAISP